MHLLRVTLPLNLGWETQLWIQHEKKYSLRASGDTHVLKKKRHTAQGWNFEAEKATLGVSFCSHRSMKNWDGPEKVVIILVGTLVPIFQESRQYPLLTVHRVHGYLLLSSFSLSLPLSPSFPLVEAAPNLPSLSPIDCDVASRLLWSDARELATLCVGGNILFGSELATLFWRELAIMLGRELATLVARELATGFGCRWKLECSLVST